MASFNIIRDTNTLKDLINKIKLSQPKTNQAGGQTVFINNETGNPVWIQAPIGTLPFGLSAWGEGPNVKYSVDISVGDYSVNNDMKNLVEFIDEFDNYIKSIPTKDPTWFKSTKTSGVVDELFRGSLRRDPNGKYPPTLKLKFHEVRGELKTTFFDSKRSPLTRDDLVKGSKIQTIIQPASVWFVNKQFGITWKVHQVKIFPPPQMQTYAFDDDDSAEIDQLDDFVTDNNSCYSPWQNSEITNELSSEIKLEA